MTRATIAGGAFATGRITTTGGATYFLGRRARAGTWSCQGRG